jgi:hypothetical protein
MTWAVLRIATQYFKRGDFTGRDDCVAALAPFLPLSEIHQCLSNNVGLGLAESKSSTPSSNVSTILPRNFYLREGKP